ncbi:MAG: FKBP-type peptidyl-prolyl cis-trans isomerase [Candidatus Melainabacteria bacterium]|nr:FKBP-type peptidyl-prolyl cis-trans isomerase [Candidatus Melainabacteria bacterium]
MKLVKKELDLHKHPHLRFRSYVVAAISMMATTACSNSTPADEATVAGPVKQTSGIRNENIFEKVETVDYNTRRMLDPNTKKEPPGKLITLPDGLQYQDLAQGWGMKPTAQKMVMVHYTGFLADGTRFESSLDKGIPFSFVLGSGKVIAGFEKGIMGMKVGGTRKVVIPPELGYGVEGHGSKVPPNSTLTYEIKLLSCDR